MTEDEARIVLRTDGNELSRLARFVDDYASRNSLPAKAVFALQLCVDEAVSNIIHHGNGAAMSTEIDVRIQHDGRTIRLDITDNGIAFDPTRVAPPVLAKTVEEAKIGGVGVYLMRHFSSAMEYERVADRNHLTVTFALPG